MEETTNLIEIDSEYKPTRKEVFSEIGSNIYKSVKKNVENFLKVNSLVYALPTGSRLGNKGNKWGNLGCNLGCGLGIITILGQGGFYFGNSANDFLPDQELYLIPAATNLVSGAYEIGRGIYKRQEKRMIESNKKDLEELTE